MLDMPQRAIRAQRTEPPRIMLARRPPQLRRRWDVQVGTILALRTKPILAELLALPLIPEIKGMRELARVALLAQSALIMLANQVSDAGTIFFGNVVPVRTERAGSAALTAGKEVGADGAVGFAGVAEGGEVGAEEGREGEGWGGCGLGVEYLGGEGGW